MLHVTLGENCRWAVPLGMRKIGLGTLTICAGVALVLLVIFSDLAPDNAESFSDAETGSTVTVDCVSLQCNRSKTGLIMTAVDRDGVQARIYLNPSVLADPVPAGSVVRVAVTPSDDDPTFLFAASVEVISYPET
jgi:hypothetical protein